jgi:hypothetical protein
MSCVSCVRNDLVPSNEKPCSTHCVLDVWMMSTHLSTECTDLQMLLNAQA